MPNYGKYRGKVVDPVDPLQLGRILALVPAISEMPLSWAMPATPYAGPGVGFFAIPPIGANVWIEFEGGDVNYPIWSGCFWQEGQVPAEPAVPTTVMLKTTMGTLSINDLDAELRLNLAASERLMSLVMNPTGITLSLDEASIAVTQEAITIKTGAGSIVVSRASVSINEGALEVI